MTIYLDAHLETSFVPDSSIIVTNSYQGHLLLKCPGLLPYTTV